MTKNPLIIAFIFWVPIALGQVEKKSGHTAPIKDISQRCKSKVFLFPAEDGMGGGLNKRYKKKAVPESTEEYCDEDDLRAKKKDLSSGLLKPKVKPEGQKKNPE